MKLRHLDGIVSRKIETSRIEQHILESGARDGPPVVFIHGNFSSSTYFESLMLAMPGNYHCIAVDLRGYGETEAALIDATRGARDWSDDLQSLLQSLEIRCAHIVAWSIGAAAAMQLTIDSPNLVTSLTLAAPISPFGFGGTKGIAGEPCNPDFSGAGGGMVAREFVNRAKIGDRGRLSPASPLNVIYGSYFYGLDQVEREQDLLTGSLSQKIGEQQYPGDSLTSDHWPFIAPGEFGPINAVSPRYFSVAALVDVHPKPPILWVRGDKDAIIDNRSESDVGVLGEAGLIPDWPGADSYPPQPMIDQTRALLECYEENGGAFSEVVFQNVGHSPFIEAPEMFLQQILQHLGEAV